mgnify:CR=1 FL=1
MHIHLKKQMALNYFDQHGHLTDEGIARYAEALRQNAVDKLPPVIVRHIEQCSSCHSQALDLYAIIADADYSQLGELRRPQAVVRRLWVVRAAAAAVLVALSWLAYRLSVPTPVAPPVVHVEPPVDSIGEQRPGQVVEPDEQTPMPTEKPREKAPQYADASFYTPSESMEGMIVSTLRSGGFTVTAPVNSDTLAVGHKLRFVWENAPEGELTLIILTNKEKEIHRSTFTAVNSYSFEGKLTPGLYYWKLEDASDLLHVGKFYIR